MLSGMHWETTLQHLLQKMRYNKPVLFVLGEKLPPIEKLLLSALTRRFFWITGALD